MSGNALGAQLESAFQSLRARWQAAAQTWEGKARNDFEHFNWEPLQQQTEASLREIASLQHVLNSAMRAVK